MTSAAYPSLSPSLPRDFLHHKGTTAQAIREVIFDHVLSGALEAAETVLDGVLREVREEAGPQVQVRPLGVVHAQTFHFDVQVPYMIGIYYLCAYEGGVIQPGDDMRDARYKWWSVEELTATDVLLHPSTYLWILQRAVALYHCWKDQPATPLQPALHL